MKRQRRTGGRFARDERGVSPVVGTVLILVIMIVSIGGIMAWGVPAIQGLQERAEYQAVLTQFLQMESDVRGLRDPQNTKLSRISVNDGRLSFDAGSRWVITGTTSEAPQNYDPVYLTGWEEARPTTLTLENVPLVGNTKIILDRVAGSVVTNVYTCPSTAHPTCDGSIDADANNDGVGDVDLSLIGSVVRVQVLEGTGAKFEAWVFNVGHIEYQLTERNRNNRLHFEMGAVFSQQDDFFYLEQSPTVKEPDYTLTPEDTSLFVRVLQLSGVVPQGVGGKGEFPIVYHLADNYGAARGRPSFDGATGARIQIHGALEVPFCNHFEDQWDGTYGWRNEVGGAPASCPQDPDDWPTTQVNLRFEEAAKPLVFDLSHSVVTTNIRSS